ncbi:MAG: methyltransferase domain-containing protein [Gammaproteobacteria bacterium]|nr:methyltransferase domain-containing protein [Gammaproteobacteria bacterium]
MSIYRKYINFTDKNSINYKLRMARLALFEELISSLPRPVRILDVGGSEFYWEHLFFSDGRNNHDDFEITITNVIESELKRSSQESSYYQYQVADARSMPQFSDKQFDVVHSNSVIEHVGDHNDQINMAKEVKRIGKHYFVQTPNYWFPIEPHFRMIGWQWLPRSTRIALIQKRKFGSFPIATSYKQAEEIVDSAQLLTYSNFRDCFPESRIEHEHFIGLTKSFIAMY